MASAIPAVGLWLPVLSCPGHVLLNSVVSCALDITVWLSHKFLKLNMYKIEFIIVPWQFHFSIFAISLNVPTNHLLRKYWLSTYFLTQYLVPYQVHLFGLLKVFLKSLCSSPLIAPEFRLPEFLTASCLIFPPLVLRQNLLLLNQVTEPRSFTWCTASQRWNLEVCSRERVYSQAAKQGDTRINLKLASLKERVRIFMG